MRLTTSILVFGFLLLTSIQIFAQSKTVNEKERNPLIDEKKNAVYLEFVKTGICNNGNYYTTIRVSPCEKKSELDERFEAVWVRLVNNTRWGILTDVQKLPVSPVVSPFYLTDKLTVEAAKDGAEFDIIYEIESETGCDFGEKAPKGETCKRRETLVPKFYRRAVSGNIFVLSGQSVIFAINQGHLKKYLTTYVFYNFEWELGGTIPLPPARYNIQHRVYYSWYDAELGIKQEAEKKQIKNTF